MAWRALDRAGTLIAASCALHCALVPLALTLIPSMTLALLSWHDPRHRMAMRLLQASRWEWLFVVTALAVAACSFGFGYLRHRDARPGLLLAAAAASFALAIAS
ncbi:MAG TPA: MerC domain-containing protein, partial [Dokdonella sp.]